MTAKLFANSRDIDNFLFFLSGNSSRSALSRSLHRPGMWRLYVNILYEPRRLHSPACGVFTRPPLPGKQTFEYYLQLEKYLSLQQQKAGAPRASRNDQQIGPDKKAKHLESKKSRPTQLHLLKRERWSFINYVSGWFSSLSLVTFAVVKTQFMASELFWSCESKFEQIFICFDVLMDFTL